MYHRCYLPEFKTFTTGHEHLFGKVSWYLFRHQYFTEILERARLQWNCEWRCQRTRAVTAHYVYGVVAVPANAVSLTRTQHVSDARLHSRCFGIAIFARQQRECPCYQVRSTQHSCRTQAAAAVHTGIDSGTPAAVEPPAER
jgi:hypothetical protein